MLLQTDQPLQFFPMCVLIRMKSVSMSHVLEFFQASKTIYAFHCLVLTIQFYIQSVMIKKCCFSIVDFSSDTLSKMASIQELEVSFFRVVSLKLNRFQQWAAIMFSNFFRTTSSSSKRSMLMSPATNCGKSPILFNNSSG